MGVLWSSTRSGRLGSAAIVCLLLCTVQSCSSGSGSTAVGTQPITPAPTVLSARAKFAYTGNEGGSISGFSVDPTSGALTGLSGFPLSAGVNPIVVVHDPLNRYLILGDIATSSLVSYTINSTTGALTPASTATTVFEAVDAVVDPSGTHVYIASQAVDAVGAFNVSATGILTPVTGQPFATGGTQLFGNSIVINSAGTVLYLQDTSGVSAFSVAMNTGALTLVQRLTIAGFAGGLALDPSGSYLYVGEEQNQVLAAYSINSANGMLTFAKNVATVGATAVAISPTGQFAYVLAEYSQLRSYTVSNGSFTMTGSVSGLYGRRIAVDPSGRFVYVPQFCSQNCPGGIYNIVNQYVIGASGVLTPVVGGTAPTGVTPTGITITTQ